MNTYGLTGKIQFDEEGIRKKFAFKVYQLEHKSPLRYVSQSYVTNKLCHIRLCFFLCILLTLILCFYLSLSINVHCLGEQSKRFCGYYFRIEKFCFCFAVAIFDVEAIFHLPYLFGNLFKNISDTAICY